MNKVLVSSAIKNESLFYINNNSKHFENKKDYSVNGRIKFIECKKIKLSEYKLKENYKHELLENPIVEIELEYINLNHTENSVEIFENNCNLVDLDNFEFSVMKNYLIDNDEICECLNLDRNIFHIYNLIPKVKHRINLFFIVPDEETEYYFKIVNGSIEEI